MTAICETSVALEGVGTTVVSAARARLLGSLLVSYMPLAYCGKVFSRRHARELDALDSRDRFCFSEQSLAATDPSSGFKFQFTQVTENPRLGSEPTRDAMAPWTPAPGGVLRWPR